MLEVREQQIYVLLDYNVEAILQITCQLKLLTVRCFRNIDILPQAENAHGELTSSEDLTTHLTCINETIPSPHISYETIFQLSYYLQRAEGC